MKLYTDEDIKYAILGGLTGIIFMTILLAVT